MNVISVIVPCYNQEEYLDECLTSVLEQTFVDWECIIVDDGSTDNSKSVANLWVKRDIRFKYIYIDNSGVSAARNIGINLSNSNYILPLDADDKIGPEYIDKAIRAFNQDSNLTLVYCQAKKFGLVNEMWNLQEFKLYNLAVDNCIFCSAVFKKEDWIKTGGYDETMLEGIEDWEFWINLLKNKGKVLKLDYIGFFYRIKDDSRQVSFNKIDKSDTINYIISKHPNFFLEASRFHKSQYDKLENSIKINVKNLFSLLIKKVKNIC